MVTKCICTPLHLLLHLYTDSLDPSVINLEIDFYMITKIWWWKWYIEDDKKIFSLKNESMYKYLLYSLCMNIIKLTSWLFV